jgi:quinoprotein glucose dehydrogenase
MRWAIPFILCALGCAQEWPSHANDAGGTRYSPLAQINRGNVAQLKPAWTWKSGDSSDGRKWPVRSAFEATPLMIGNVLYVVTPFARLVALDAESGRELWAFDPKFDREKPYNLYINRGAAYWTDGRRGRLLYGTLDGRLFSIDSSTGKPDPAFGDSGVVNLRAGFTDKWPTSGMGLTSPPAVYRNIVICGSLVPDRDPQGPSGDVRGFDVLTGKEVWRFHTVPREGEFGYDTWQSGSTQDRGGVNAWSLLTLDTQRGIVYLPLTSPSYDFYGGDRKGAGLFGNSLVALDAATGKRLWHFQTVHHDLWDYDLPAQPVLVEVLRNGRKIPAVAQITKMGFTFILDRVTGKPLYDVEERPVPASTIPGEQSWPTQPFPVKPPSFARQSMKPEELTAVSAESRQRCQAMMEGATFGQLYTPLRENTTILFPGTNGGANWPGPSYDPETRTLYVNSMDVGMIFKMEQRPEGSVVPYRARSLGPGGDRFWDQDQNPCQQPPWGHLTAISLDSGEFRWRSVLGVVDKLIEKGLPPTGTSNLGTSIVTAGGLVFIGATNDARFRAFDKLTGKELWVTRLSASAHAAPMTYLGAKSKRQFVVIAVGGGNKYNATYSDELVAFSLP